jgi:hypothetical protein
MVVIDLVQQRLATDGLNILMVAQEFVPPLKPVPLYCWAVGRAQPQGYQLGDTKFNLKSA